MRNEELLVSNFEYFGGKLIKHFICDLWLFILILILSGLRNNGKQLERKPPHAPELGTELQIVKGGKISKLIMKAPEMVCHLLTYFDWQKVS